MKIIFVHDHKLKREFETADGGKSVSRSFPLTTTTQRDKARKLKTLAYINKRGVSLVIGEAMITARCMEVDALQYQQPPRSFRVTGTRPMSSKRARSPGSPSPSERATVRTYYNCFISLADPFIVSILPEKVHKNRCWPRLPEGRLLCRRDCC